MTDDEIMQVADKHYLLAFEARKKEGSVEQNFVEAWVKALLATVRECVATAVKEAKDLPQF